MMKIVTGDFEFQLNVQSFFLIAHFFLISDRKNFAKYLLFLVYVNAPELLNQNFGSAGGSALEDRQSEKTFKMFTELMVFYYWIAEQLSLGTLLVGTKADRAVFFACHSIGFLRRILWPCVLPFPFSLSVKKNGYQICDDLMFKLALVLEITPMLFWWHYSFAFFLSSIRAVVVRAQIAKKNSEKNSAPGTPYTEDEQFYKSAAPGLLKEVQFFFLFFLFFTLFFFLLFSL